MNRTFKTIIASALLFVSVQTVKAQDVAMNIISQENGVNDGVWEMGAKEGTVTIMMTICNNATGFQVIPAYKLRPLLSVNPAVVRIAADQPGLPPGWTILAQNDEGIRFSNGTDPIEAADCREFSIVLMPVAPGEMVATGGMFFSNGQAPGSVPGPATAGDSYINNNPLTGIVVTERLPVTLSSFTVLGESKVANINWATTEETNSDRFEIERSADGKTWSHIGTVASVGDSKRFSEYNFVDGNPLIGENIYRLKMIDLDETFTHSRMKSLHFDGVAADVSVYPNPTSDVVYIRDYQSVANISVVDLQGKEVYKSGAIDREAISTTSLISGVYVMHIGRKDGSSTAHKIVIVK